jgi:transcriptional regulator with XRE-family HTH domain
MTTKLLRPLTSKQESLGKRVRLARIARGLTQQQLAALVYITQSGISDIEKDISEPRWTLMLAIIRVLKCEIDYFL